MEIQKKDQGNELVMFLSGKLTAVEAPKLESEMESVRQDYDVIVIDLENLAYISSAGLRVLVSNQKKMLKKNGKQLIRRMNPDIRDVFRVTGLEDILNIDE